MAALPPVPGIPPVPFGTPLPLAPAVPPTLADLTNWSNYQLMCEANAGK